MRNSWQRVKSETIVKSLKKCGISNVLDGIEDDILYEQSVASSETTMKVILEAVKKIFWVSMKNKLYYISQFWYVTILFSSNKLLNLKYIYHSSNFPKISNENITARLMDLFVL